MLFNCGDVIYINEFGLAKRVYDSVSKDIDIMMTIHCNSNCIMCPISEGARQSNETGYIGWVKELIKHLPYDVEHICITGGEPTLMREELFRILDLLKKKFPVSDFQFLSNGRSCGNADFCRQLVDHFPDNILIGVPLHADKSDIHDKISQTPGSFEQTVQGIKNLLALHQSVELRIVVSKLNVDHLSSLGNFIAKELQGISRAAFMGMEMMGNAVKNIDAVWIPYADAVAACEPVLEKLIVAGIDAMLFNYPLCLLHKKYWFLAKQSISPYKVRFYEQCDNCLVKGTCSGFFQSTKNIKQTDVKPVEENENELF